MLKVLFLDSSEPIPNDIKHEETIIIQVSHYSQYFGPVFEIIKDRYGEPRSIDGQDLIEILYDYTRQDY